MELSGKRLITSMILAISITASIASGAMCLKHANQLNELDYKIEQKELDLYHKVKYETTFHENYNKLVDNINADFDCGNIDNQTYNNKLSELNKPVGIIDMMIENNYKCSSSYSDCINEIKQLKKQQETEQGLGLGYLAGLSVSSVALGLSFTSVSNRDSELEKNK